MTDELTQVTLPAVEPVAEVAAGAAPALDPQQLVNAADFAGMLANDPEATQRYLDSLLRVMELVDDAGRLVEVIPLW